MMKNLRKHVCLALLAAMLLGLCACGATPTQPTPAATAAPATAEDVSAPGELTLAVLIPNATLDYMAAQFNDTAPGFTVRVVDYSDGTAYTPEQAAARLTTEIISGKGPDMVCFNGISPYPYIRSGMLANIGAFIAQDGDISLDDIVIADVLKEGEGIYFMASSFAVDSMVARTDRFGARYGWTVDEYLDMDRSLPPDVQLINNMSREIYIDYILSRYIRETVDWENGKCNFESEDFIRMLEVGKSIRETTQDPDNTQFGLGGQLVASGYRIVANSLVDSVWIMALEKQLAGCELSYIGWPTPDGSCGSDAMLKDSIGIISTGQSTERCWKFIKYMVMNAPNGLDLPRMPVYKPLLDAAIKEAHTSDSLQVKVTDADADSFYALIDRVKNSTLYDTQMLRIISEESQAYFNGDKTAAEAARIIQSKASIYLAEQYG